MTARVAINARLIFFAERQLLKRVPGRTTGVVETLIMLRALQASILAFAARNTGESSKESVVFVPDLV